MNFTPEKRDKELCGKRWTSGDVHKFLEILIAKGRENLERPTAQIFYKQIIEENREILGTNGWMGMRDKLKYLKKKYVKALAWRNNEGAGLMEDEDYSSVNAYIEKMCPEFEELDELFGNKSNNQLPVDSKGDFHTIFENEVTISVPNSPQSNMDTPEYKYNVCTSPSQGNTCATENRDSLRYQRRQEKRRNNSQGKAMSSMKLLVQMQADRQKYLDKKLEWEMTVHAETQETKRLKLEVERERIQSEERQKEKELQFKLSIEKARLAHEFDLKKLELNLKYKGNSAHSPDTGPDKD